MTSQENRTIFDDTKPTASNNNNNNQTRTTKRKRQADRDGPFKKSRKNKSIQDKLYEEKSKTSEEIEHDENGTQQKNSSKENIRVLEEIECSKNRTPQENSPEENIKLLEEAIREGPMIDMDNVDYYDGTIHWEKCKEITVFMTDETILLPSETYLEVITKMENLKHLIILSEKDLLLQILKNLDKIIERCPKLCYIEFKEDVGCSMFQMMITRKSFKVEGKMSKIGDMWIYFDMDWLENSFIEWEGNAWVYQLFADKLYLNLVENDNIEVEETPYFNVIPTPLHKVTPHSVFFKKTKQIKTYILSQKMFEGKTVNYLFTDFSGWDFDSEEDVESCVFQMKTLKGLSKKSPSISLWKIKKGNLMSSLSHGAIPKGTKFVMNVNIK